MNAAKDHIRGQIDAAGYPLLAGGDLTAIPETVNDDEMAFLIEAVKRLQQRQA